MEPPRFESEGRRAKQEEDKVEEEDNCLKQFSLSDLLGKDDFMAEEVFYDQELLSGVMKSLAAEITGSNPCPIPSSEPYLSVYDPASADDVCNVDLEYLLGATDDELGIPPSPNCVAENEFMDAFVAQDPTQDLFENPLPESHVEGVMQLYESDCWYGPYEYEFAMLNETLCEECQTRSLQEDATGDCYGCLSMEKAGKHRVEYDVGR